MPEAFCFGIRPGAFFWGCMLATVNDDLLSQREVLARLGVSRATLYRMMNQHSFPRPLAIAGGRGTNRWLRSELDTWLETRPRRGSEA